MDAIILLSLLLVASALFYFYLRWLTRYFEDISKGMDALLQDVAGEISLPPELLPIERKMNLAKHTIDRQKSDMILSGHSWAGTSSSQRRRWPISTFV